MKPIKKVILINLTVFLSLSLFAQKSNYKIVDTGQKEFFNNTEVISPPSKGDSFYGQDAQYNGNKPSYTDNGNGTITDNVTGLIWQKEYKKMTYPEAIEALKTFNLANNTDWRLPTIKEAYSLIQFSGVDISPNGMSTSASLWDIPFIDINYFDFSYAANGDRPIDSQMLTSTIYNGVTMGKDKTVFGVNFADGRIKGYPLKQRDADKYYMVRFVRGNDYGINEFVDNNNGTINDTATELMWEKGDSEKKMSWGKSLKYATKMNKKNYLGHSDWRVPNAKELQSIVDYTRSPQKTNSAAIDSIFEISIIKDEAKKNNYPFYWSSTTHKSTKADNEGGAAVYICFGEALGFMSKSKPGSRQRLNENSSNGHSQQGPRQGRQGAGQGKRGGRQQGGGSRPPQGGERAEVSGTWLDVHGAGSQRSDPKEGNTSDFPRGLGPQGDVIRINNYVKLVRDI